MATARTIRFGESMILVGDGATPTENFTAPCGFTELTMTMVINTEDTEVPDCDDPDSMVWLITDVRSQQMRMSGSGVLDRDALALWHNWYYVNAGAEKNVRWFRNIPGADNGGYYQGPGVLTAYEENAQRRGRYNISVGIAINGRPSFVATA